MPTTVVRQRRPKTSKEERICSICSQAFKKAEHLARHIRSHTKEKPFQCNICGRHYTRHDTLLRHSRSHNQCVSGENSIQDATEPITLPMEISSVFPHTPNPSITVDSATLSRPLGEPTNTLLPDKSQECGLNNATELEDSSIWPFTVDIGWSSWLANEHFGLDAINLSLLQASDYAGHTVNEVMDQSFANFAIEPIDDNQSDPQPSLRRTWYTHTAVELPETRTPPSSRSPDSLDDAYRKRLAENLRRNVQHGILPSTSFLNLCMQAYFTHFHPVFPIIHAPSFQPSTQTSILLLSICSIGSLFLGSPRAVAQGTSMFERLNKAILVSWDRYLSKQDSSCMIVLQASMIGQTFGVLMGRPKDLAGIDVFHGCLISWARMAKMFKEETPETLNITDLDGENLQAAWRAWISAEERKRFVLSIYLLDAELAKLRHHEPTLRRFGNELPRAASSKLFAAPSAEQWKALMLEYQAGDSTSVKTTTEGLHVGQTRVQRAEDITDFERSVSLDSIAALAYEQRSSENAERCRRLLMDWYEQNRRQLQLNKHSRPGLLMLWHSVFLVVYADLDTLERACGRDGEDASWKAIPYAQEWASSANGVRCILHAMQIQAHFETMPVGTEPFIHVPMCLYHCGLVWFCFSRFVQTQQARSLGASLQFPEMSLLGNNRSIEEVKAMVLEYNDGQRAGYAGLKRVFVVIDLLQRIVHWKIAQSFATTLLAMVEAEQAIF